VLARHADEALAVAVVRQERRSISDECARLKEENARLAERVAYLERRLRRATICVAVLRGSRERLEARLRLEADASEATIGTLVRLAFPQERDEP
jgi:phage shock protein A